MAQVELKLLKFSIVGVFGILLSTQSFGAAFQISEQNGRQLGHAYAGAAALPQDASTIFYNPAGMSSLEKSNIAFSVASINLAAQFDNANSGDGTSSGTAAVGNKEGGNGGGQFNIPTLYYAYGMGDMAFGLGVSAPFGLTTKWDDDWMGRFHAIESSIQVLEIAPAFSYQVTKSFAFGFSVGYQMMSAKFTNALDIHSICFGAQLQGGADTATAATNCSALAGVEGEASIEGTSNAFGFNLGIQYRPTDETTIGVTWRGAVKHSLTGEAKFTNTAAFAAAGVLQDTDVESEITLPDTLALAIAHTHGDFTLAADYTFTRWNSIQELRVEFDNNTPDSVDEYDWVNSHKVAFGGVYRVSKMMPLKLGFALDQTPIPSDSSRNARLPDGDRTWYTAGFGYETDMWDVNLGYAHIYIKDGATSRTASTGQTLNGVFRGTLDIFALQANVRI